MKCGRGCTLRLTQRPCPACRRCRRCGPWHRACSRSGCRAPAAARTLPSSPARPDQAAERPCARSSGAQSLQFLSLQRCWLPGAHATAGGRRADDIASLRFAGWTLEPARRRLLNPEGVEVPLTGGEYDLLVALVERANRVLTRDMLLDLLRGRQAGPFDRAIDVAISRLRRLHGGHGRAHFGSGMAQAPVTGPVVSTSNGAASVRSTRCELGPTMLLSVSSERSSR